MGPEMLLILWFPLLRAKPAPAPRSLTSPLPWDSQTESDYSKFNLYQQEMEELLNKSYFAKVNNKTKVILGETAFLPCRIKDLKEGYTVRLQYN